LRIPVSVDCLAQHYRQITGHYPITTDQLTKKRRTEMRLF